MEPIDEEQGLIGRRPGGADGGGESNLSRRTWPTVDGPHGLSEEESLAYARSYFYWGFAFLPFLWAVNCCYFWPVLRKSHPSPHIRPYIVRSAIGFLIFSVVLASWSVTFMVGGEQLFGSVWNDLVMYNLADRVQVNSRGGQVNEPASEVDVFFFARIHMCFLFSKVISNVKNRYGKGKR